MKSFTVDKFVETTDKMNPSMFGEWFEENAIWAFGNLEPLKGRSAIEGFAQQFFDALEEIDHQISGKSESSELAFFEGRCTYHKKDGAVIELPFACSVRLKDGLISEYRTYIDPAPYFS